ncbi:MAG: hypothetical protein KDA75_09820 [Planctomycetaceae bacterium]|nr:hypothetical protein [Planctomycetaceae bacterium]
MSSSLQISITLLEALNADLRKQVAQQSVSERSLSATIGSTLKNYAMLWRLASASLTVSLLVLAGGVLTTWQ